MNCLRHVVNRVLTDGYSHHIERLMGITNFCMLAGIDPADPVLAADAGSPVTMGLVQRAARTEYAKLARPLTPAETGGWILEEVR